MKLSNQQLSNAIQFIIENTREEGLIRAYAEDLTEGQIEFEDLTTFVTGFTGIHLMDIKHPLLIELKQKMLLFLSNEVINSRFWMWSAIGSDLRKYIPLDIDTTSINSEYCLMNGIHLNNIDTLLRNIHRKENYGFYSWIIPRFKHLANNPKTIFTILRHSFCSPKYWIITPSKPNEYNAFMTVNLFHYLILKDPKHLKSAELFLNQFESIDDMKDIYYKNELLNFYLISRILYYSKNKSLINRFIPQINDIDQLQDIELASILLTYKNLNLKIPSFWKKNLIQRQHLSGSWSTKDVFTYGDSMTWRSPALTTSMVLSALN
jgi:hypothetical protein